MFYREALFNIESINQNPNKIMAMVGPVNTVHIEALNQVLVQSNILEVRNRYENTRKHMKMVLKVDDNSMTNLLRAFSSINESTSLYPPCKLSYCCCTL